MSVLTDEQVSTLIGRAMISSAVNTVVCGDSAFRTALQEAARLGAEIEREACAKVCEDIAEAHLRSGRYSSVVADHSVRAGGQVDGAEECAEAIRARAGKEGG